MTTDNFFDGTFYIKHNGAVTECKVDFFLICLGRIIIDKGEDGIDLSHSFHSIYLTLADGDVLLFNRKRGKGFSLYRNTYECSCDNKKFAVISYNSTTDKLFLNTIFPIKDVYKDLSFYTRLDKTLSWYPWLKGKCFILRWIFRRKWQTLKSYVMVNGKPTITDVLAKNTFTDLCKNFKVFNRIDTDGYYWDDELCYNEWLKNNKFNIEVKRFKEVEEEKDDK